MFASSHPAESRRAARARVLAWACLVVFVSTLAARSPRAATTDEVLTLDEAAAYLRIDADELAALAGRSEIPGRRIGEDWRFHRPALDAWLAGGDPIADETLARTRGRGPEAAPTEADAASAEQAEEAEAAEPEAASQTEPAPAKSTPTVGYPPKGKTAAEIFLRRQAVLLQQGELIIEPSIIYSNAQQREFFAVNLDDPDVGNLEFYESITVTDRIGAGQLFVRYGLFDETEAYAGIRYRGFHSSASSDFKSDPDADISFGDDRLGKASATDVMLGLSRTLLHESLYIPDIVFSVEGTVPVAHASPTLGGKLWLLKSFDPIVIYGGADYRYAWGRNYSNVNLLVADHRVRGTMGYAFSVNDSLTLSTSVSGAWASESDRVDPSPDLVDEDDPDAGFEDPNRTLSARETWSLRLALTGRMRGGVYIEPSVTIGLSGPGNWVAVGLTVPWFVTDLR